MRANLMTCVLMVMAGALPILGGILNDDPCLEGTNVADPFDPKCVHAPTALPCVIPGTSDPDGYRTHEGLKSCGVKIRWIFFSKPCGRPLAGSACAEV